MKKIIPFKKNIGFKTNLSEIVSISLEHNLKQTDDNLISGDFIISGTYKMTDNSLNIDEFNYKLPFDINMSEKYIIDRVNIEIDDFFYEIINDNILSVNIDVLVDNIEEKKVDEVPFETNKTPYVDILEEIKKDEIEETIKEDEDRDCYEEDEFPPRIENNNIEVKSLFESIDDSIETYSTYNIYIVREGDTIETIIQKYKVQKDILELYNDINELKIGDKLIIPVLDNEKV